MSFRNVHHPYLRAPLRYPTRNPALTRPFVKSLDKKVRRHHGNANEVDFERRDGELSTRGRQSTAYRLPRHRQRRSSMPVSQIRQQSAEGPERRRIGVASDARCRWCTFLNGMSYMIRNIQRSDTNTTNNHGNRHGDGILQPGWTNRCTRWKEMVL